MKIYLMCPKTTNCEINDEIWRIATRIGREIFGDDATFVMISRTSDCSMAQYIANISSRIVNSDAVLAIDGVGSDKYPIVNEMELIVTERLIKLMNYTNVTKIQSDHIVVQAEKKVCADD